MRADRNISFFIYFLALLAVSLHFAALAQSDRDGNKPPHPSLKSPEGSAEADTKQKTPEEMTVKLNTALVSVPVIVTDRDGKFIPNLTQRNFSLYEENVRQSIDNFSSIEVPFNVVLILDTSGSTRFKLEDIQEAALSFIDQLREQDRVMIVSFDSQVYVDSEFTSDRKKLRKAILQTRTGGATRLYDSIDLVLTERLAKVTGRKAIVLFSDGVDTASKLATAPSTVDLVEESGVLLYAVQYDTKEDVRHGIVGTARGGSRPVTIQIPTTGASVEDYQRADRYMKELTDRSGARLYKADLLGDIKQAFQLIADELRHQYTISYYPSNDKRDGSYRRIRVVVDQSNVAVRARKGYRAESGESEQQ
ncbi:MAG: VWA domain-containing protein [Blastocatellia bacterium]|nr:VWA domain-containing protein [Blastocatellia bacterium]